MMPYIDINEDTATARWYLLLSATQKDNTALWISGIEDYNYIKVDGRWFVHHKKATFSFIAPYDKGWAQ